jgi:hypothetical protein
MASHVLLAVRFFSELLNALRWGLLLAVYTQSVQRSFTLSRMDLVVRHLKLNSKFVRNLSKRNNRRESLEDLHDLKHIDYRLCLYNTFKNILMQKETRFLTSVSLIVEHYIYVYVQKWQKCIWHKQNRKGHILKMYVFRWSATSTFCITVKINVGAFYVFSSLAVLRQLLRVAINCEISVFRMCLVQNLPGLASFSNCKSFMFRMCLVQIPPGLVSVSFFITCRRILCNTVCVGLLWLFCCRLKQAVKLQKQS